jgi:hypothetical protein
MNPHRILTALIASSAISQAAPVSKLAAEWFVPSTSNTKQFSLVDTATGTVRIGFVSSNGEVSWLHTLNTGITAVSDVASSLPALVGESIALTSPLSNRVVLVNVDAPNPIARVLPTINGIGPVGLTETIIGGTTELAITSIHNGGTSFGKTEFRNDIGNNSNLLAQNNIVLNFRQLIPLKDPANPANRVAFYTGTSGSNTLTGLLTRSGGSVTRQPKLTFAGAFEFLPGVLDINGTAGNTLLIGHRPATSSAHIYRAISPIATATFTNTSTTFPFTISGIIPILDGGVGPMTDGLIALAADGSEARWLQVNAAANAFIATSQSFTPTPGSALTGLLPLPGIGLMQLEGPSATGPSTTFKSLLWDSENSQWTQIESGTIPQIPTPGQSIASLLFYSANPAENEAARLLAIQTLPDWTRPQFFPDPFPSSVIQETFTSPTDGLTFSNTASVSPPFGTNFVMTNQVEPSVSITALGGADALFSPDLLINPPSGPQSASFQITALYDEERQELLWRDANGGSWQLWSGPIPVAYNRSFQFSLRSIANGNLGPIQNRSYTFDPASLASQDSDNDGVPDYVELQRGLDPFSGPDHDGDGVSDLAELLKSTNPNNSAEFPTEDSIADISTTGGFSLVATARIHTSSEIRNTEELFAHDLGGSLLDRQAVATISPALPDGGTRGAILRSGTPIPNDELLALSSPLYFDITSGARTGREIIGFIPVPAPTTFSPIFSPSGTNLTNDANAWVLAAQTAATDLPPAPVRTIIAPPDSAVSILLEEIIHRALTAARPPSNPAPPLDAFTLFPSRDGDRTLTPLTPEDIDLLQSSGFDFRLALTLANTARANMLTCANNLYSRHATTSASTPGIIMPIDALRIMLRGGPAPTGYSGAVTSGNLTTAINAYNTAITSESQALRPSETWTIEIPETSPGPGIYHRIPGEIAVALLSPSGDRFRLEQGLGLRPGTRFQITGFTDTPADGPYTTIQVTSALLTFQPASSDTDTDANLLDDEWERFFFGAIGQDLSSTPGTSSHTLLQYFLEGLDPRGDASPTSTPVDLSPQQPLLTSVSGGGFTLDFTFPTEFQDRFDFILEKSTTLLANSFETVPDAIITVSGPNQLQATIPPSAATTDTGFYRIRLSLKTD